MTKKFWIFAVALLLAVPWMVRWLLGDIPFFIDEGVDGKGASKRSEAPKKPAHGGGGAIDTSTSSYGAPGAAAPSMAAPQGLQGPPPMPYSPPPMVGGPMPMPVVAPPMPMEPPAMPEMVVPIGGGMPVDVASQALKAKPSSSKESAKSTVKQAVDKQKGPEIPKKPKSAATLHDHSKKAAQGAEKAQ